MVTSFISGGVGLVMVLAGTGLLVRSRKLREKAEKQRIEVGVGPGSLTIRGEF